MVQKLFDKSPTTHSVCDIFTSWTHPVRSGVTEETILGPILFLIYVNDISSNISFSTKMFADDKKVYSRISDFVNDTLWQLRFNPEKCN